MQSILDWIVANKQWVFSGIGVVALTAFVGFFVKRKRTNGRRQQQSTRGISTNFQAGKNINVTFYEEQKPLDPLVMRASLSDVKRFDPNYKNLIMGISENERLEFYSRLPRITIKRKTKRMWIGLILILIIAAVTHLIFNLIDSP